MDSPEARLWLGIAEDGPYIHQEVEVAPHEVLLSADLATEMEGPGLHVQLAIRFPAADPGGGAVEEHD